MVESICTRSCECRTIPSILITGSLIVSSVVVLTDVEVEGVSTRAIVYVVIVVGIGTTLGIVDFVPKELFTGILIV